SSAFHQRPTSGATGEKQKKRKAKVAKEDDIGTLEDSAEDVNSTGAIAENSTPDLTSVGTPSAIGITAPEKSVVKKAIDHDCGSDKSVGQCDSHGLVQNSCRLIVVSWLSRIASKPERLRNSFRKHFYQQRTHTEIADELGISYDNVCKRISLARKVLKERLRVYFQGSDGKVATVGTPQRPTPGATAEKLNKREAKTKVAKENDRVTIEGSAEDINSTDAITENSTPDISLFCHSPKTLAIFKF
ncbi:MAG: sigma-70 family RNA polymerase sigma factor, partial [Symploca sp. SIO1C4]|nr:sigma-70 family RNA polymerase sigma factor [Symploca sp. SIO1C4]